MWLILGNISEFKNSEMFYQFWNIQLENYFYIFFREFKYLDGILFIM